MGRFPKLVPERFYNYVQNSEPTPPGGVEEGETWYEPGTANSYVYDGTEWIDLTVVAHSQLSGISADDHHNPVTTSDPLTVDAGQGLGLSLSSNLVVSGGDLDIGFEPAPAYSVEEVTRTISPDQNLSIPMGVDRPQWVATPTVYADDGSTIYFENSAPLQLRGTDGPDEVIVKSYASGDKDIVVRVLHE